MGDMILTKLIALLQGSELESLTDGYLGVLNQRRDVAKEFLEEVLNNRQKSANNFKAYGCLSHGHRYGPINGLGQSRKAMIRSSEIRVGAKEIDFSAEECRPGRLPMFNH